MRPAKYVMNADTLFKMEATPLSFSNVMLHKWETEGWELEFISAYMDEQGEGYRKYELVANGNTYTFLIFFHNIADSLRKDSSTATSWDSTAALIDGKVDDVLFEELSDKIPLQEATRQYHKQIIMGRFNKSISNMRKFRANPREPVPYLYRNSATYGSGKFGMMSYHSYKDRQEFKISYVAEMAFLFIARQAITERVEETLREAVDPEVKAQIGIGNASAYGLVRFILQNQKMFGHWMEVREMVIQDLFEGDKSLGAEYDLTEDKEKYITELLNENKELVVKYYDKLCLCRRRYEPIDKNVRTDEFAKTIKEKLPFIFDVNWYVPRSLRLVYYESEDKSEPLVADRFHSWTGKKLEIDLAYDIYKLYKKLNRTSKETMSEFVRVHPEYKRIVQSAQIATKMPYGIVHSNTNDCFFNPQSLIKAKLAWMGATDFDLRDDGWVRVLLFKGIEEKPCGPVIG